MAGSGIRRGLARLIGPAAALAAVAVAAGIAVTASGAAAHPGIPSSRFDPDAVGWASVRDYNEVDFKATFDAYARDGYLVVDLDADMSGESLRLGAVFQKNLDGRAWFVKTRLTAQEYKDTFDAQDRAGMRLVDMETYVRNGVRYYGAVWVQNLEKYGYHARHNLTYDEFKKYYEEQKDRRMPVDVDVYPTGAGLRWGVIWVDNAEKLGWRLHGSLTREEYQKAVDDYKEQGLRSLVFDSALDGAGGGQRYAGVWVENTNKRGWWVRSDLTWQEYSNWWHRYADMGFRSINLERYETAAGTRYAGVWRQNDARFGWSLRDDVDGLVQGKLDELVMPGISVAVIQNGQFRYRRGFGHADVDDNVWLDSDHVQRMASVAKAVGGTLTMRLIEQGELAEGDDVRDLVNGLPDHHEYTVEQLASNRGCVRHYAGGGDPAAWETADDTLGGTEYNTAAAAAPMFWNDDLVCEPGDWNYSTHGYTILGAALEGATGESVSDLVLDELTGPFGLGTLRPEDMDDTDVRRTTLYDSANNEVAADEVSWKVLGGGLEATVADLASFGRKLIDGEILDDDSLDDMWVGAPWGYHYGWGIETEDGHRLVQKNGSWTGSTAYLQMYPDDGIVIAVMMNRSDNDDDANHAELLGREIGSLVLGA